MHYLSDLQRIISSSTPSLSSVAGFDQRFIGFVASWQNGLIDTLMRSVPLEMKSKEETPSNENTFTNPFFLPAI
jgi:hypothetical protein